MRVGSVIAGHLSELDRSRKYRSIQSEDESSVQSSETFKSRQKDTGDGGGGGCDVISTGDFDIPSGIDSLWFNCGGRQKTIQKNVTEVLLIIYTNS